MHITHDLVTQLAPDDAAAKAGMQLATPAKWLHAHAHSTALWGECKGSGSTPYFTQIDLQQVAFKCSCPSRKFPCKHGLGLMWLYVKEPAFFTQESQVADRVTEWLNKRQEKAGIKAEKAAKQEKTTDETAQLKRSYQREQKVEQGLDELESWMKDIIRTGIKHMPTQQYTLFQHIVARMVDAQASGVANQLRDISEINYYSHNWETEFMKQFSLLYFLVQAYRNRAALPTEWQQELRGRLGWNTNKEELAALPLRECSWSVLRVERNPFDKLIAEKTWLLNLDTHEIAYQLQFFMPQQASSMQMYAIGLVLKAKTVHYPGRASLRLWIKEAVVQPDKYRPLTHPTDMASLMDEISRIKQLNPLKEEIPFLMAEVRVVNAKGKWFLIDARQKGLPVKQDEKELLKIWALTASQPITAFVLYRDEAFRILRVFPDDNTKTL